MQTNMKKPDDFSENGDSPIGLTRFHMVTIGSGGVLCFAFAVRMFLIYQQSGGWGDLSQAAVSLLLGSGLLLYLRRFKSRGI